MTRSKRIGVFGGSFDPFHRGHRELLYAANRHFKFDFVYVVPNPQNPLKDRPHFSKKMRYDSLRREIKKIPFARMCRMEWDRSKPGYTFETLRQLKKRHARAQFWFICGSDTLAGMSKWKYPERVTRIARIAATRRQGGPAVSKYAWVDEFRMKPVAASSTRIRRSLQSKNHS